MVVKVQVVEANTTVPMARIESKDGKVRFAVPMTEALSGRMAGSSLRFFHGIMDPATASFEIGEAARPEQW